MWSLGVFILGRWVHKFLDRNTLIIVELMHYKKTYEPKVFHAWVTV